MVVADAQCPAPWETGMVELVLKSLTVLSDTTAAVTFEGDDGGEVTFQFELHETGPQGLTVTNGDADFQQKYRRVPGPSFPLWPERLVAQALFARREPFPYGAELEHLTEQVRRDLTERWERDRQAG
jgi:hypothetical protein